MNSLSTRVAVFSAAVLLVLMVLVGIWVESQLRRAIQQQELEQAEIHARTLLASLQTLMLKGNGTLARDWLDNMKGTAGIVNIEVLRPDGISAFRDLLTVNRVNQYLGENRFQREPSMPDQTTQKPFSDAFNSAIAGQIAFEFHGDTKLSVFLPIPGEIACLTCHGYDDSVLRGVLSLGLTTEKTQQRIDNMRNSLWAILGMVVIILGLTLFWILHYNVLAPIASLHAAISRVTAGDLEAKLPVVRNDELGQVARIFNQMQIALKSSEARIRAVMDNVVESVIIIDEHGIIESINPAVEKLFGYDKEELIGENVKMLAPKGHQSPQDEYIESYLDAGVTNIVGSVREMSGLRKDGTVFPMDIGVSQMEVGDKKYFIGVARDITHRREQTAALRHQALHDGLTDLPNRVLLYDRLEQSILIGQREKRRFAIMEMDLNGFKAINDRLGHHYGDLVLQEVSRRVRKTLRGSDTIARLGGDEFAVLLPGSNKRTAVQMAQRILKSLVRPLPLRGEALLLGASIGIALFPEHGEDSVSIMQKADSAMYAAKRAGEGYTVYDPQQDQYHYEHWLRVADLKDAIRNQELVLHYQPKIELASGLICSVEALVRWNHPKHGMLLPEEFIPIAETTGIIKPITLWVLRTALAQWRSWRERGWQIGVAVNLSVRSLQDATFVEELQTVVQEYQNTALPIKLEITETSIMADPARAIQILNRLNKFGVHLSIDDFGIGYSSLSYLKQLPVDELKIDKSFISAMPTHEESVVIVRSTIDLAHKLGLFVVAEGVESNSTFKLLAKLGCDAVQGYYISRPLPDIEFQEWVVHSGWKVRWSDQSNGPLKSV